MDMVGEAITGVFGIIGILILIMVFMALGMDLNWVGIIGDGIVGDGTTGVGIIGDGTVGDIHTIIDLTEDDMLIIVIYATEEE